MAKFLLMPASYATVFQIGILFASILNLTNCRERRIGFRDIVEYAGFFNEESNCTTEIQEIFEYIALGERDIQKPEEKDVVIVVGLSGVGKSTLVQFIGNASNELMATCDSGGNCLINDETGSIGDDLISKTFLPNLVVDTDSNTPYFDMPGFADNRNATMEVANSFFMQQALGVCERIKILMLATDASFSITQKQDFVSLMNSFVNLFKNPSKFAGSIGMIATIASAYKNHDQRMNTYTNFLFDNLKPVVDDLLEGDNIGRVHETIDAILYSETGYPNGTKYLRYFISPLESGFLSELKTISTYGILCTQT